MTTYTVNTYNDKATYKVVLDDNGVVEVDGLVGSSVESLKTAVKKHIVRNGLSPVNALAKSIGPYSFLSEGEGDVSDQAQSPAVV